MSTTYRDDRITIDDDRIQIRSLFKTRDIPLADVRDARLIELGMSRYRLIGIDPTRPRTWFTADPGRRRRRQGIEIDVGRLLRIGITPEDPIAALDAIERSSRTEAAGGSESERPPTEPGSAS